MIAHYGSRLQKDLTLDKYTISQIEIFGTATIAPGGNMITLNMSDLNRIRNPLNKLKDERYQCG